MATKKSLLTGVGEAIRARLTTIIVWLVIFLVIYVVVQVNKANRDKTVANLSNPSTRGAEVLNWAKQGRLADALTETQDPNTDDKSPTNVASAKIREACATELLSLIDGGQIDEDTAFDNLYALHKDSDGAVKKSTITGLANLGKKSDAGLTKLVNRLADGDPDVRSASTDALASIGSDQVITKVVAAVNGTPAGAKADALTTLSKIGKPTSPSIVALLDTPDITFKGQLITMLGTIGDARSIPALTQIAQAQPRDPSLRRLTLLALSAIIVATLPSAQPSVAAAVAGAPAAPAGPTPEERQLAMTASPVLIGAVNDNTDDSRARAQCALALGRVKSPEATTALVAALGDIDTRIAVAARSGLQSAGGVAVSAVAAATKSANPQVRAGAAYALGGIGTSEALAAMGSSLVDPVDDVRRAACQALGHSANPAAVPLLVARLSDDNGFVAGEAANSLELLGKEAVPALVAVLGSPSPTAPIYATDALASIGGDATSAVEAAAETGSDKQKTWCAVVLGRIHDPKSEAVLQKLATSSDPSTKFAATEALKQFSV